MRDIFFSKKLRNGLFLKEGFKCNFLKKLKN